MMNLVEELYRTYDKVVSTTLVNFMIEDNRNNGLAFYSFDPENKEHLYAFEIALILSQSIHKKFYLDIDFFKYWKFRFKNWTVRKSFSRYTAKNKVSWLELVNILNYIKKELGLDDEIYEQIYENYYAEGAKYRSLHRRKYNK